MAGTLNLTEGAAPSTPASGLHALYVATDGAWHVLSDAGVDAILSAGADVVLETASITDANVTNAKLASMAESTIKGRAVDAGTGVPADLTPTEVVEMIIGEFAAPAEDTDASWTSMAPLATGYITTTFFPDGHTYPIASYRKVAGVIYLRGAGRVSPAASLLAPLMDTLPSGYRPANDTPFRAYMSASDSVPQLTTIFVYANGEIRTTGVKGMTYHLDGIFFVPA